MCALLIRAEFGGRANAVQRPLLWNRTCWADRTLGEGVSALDKRLPTRTEHASLMGNIRSRRGDN